MIIMVKKILCMLIISIFIGSGFVTGMSVTIKQKMVHEKNIFNNVILGDGDIKTKTGGYDGMLTSAVALQSCGRFWIDKWNMWYYPFNISWYNIKYGKDNKLEKEKYVAFSVDLSVKAEGIAEDSEDVFDAGGWNVTKLREDGDFEKWAKVICSVLIGAFPSTYRLHFTSGLALAEALCYSKNKDPKKPAYEWIGEQIKEASGICKFGCLVPPGTYFKIDFEFNFFGSTLNDEDYHPEYRYWDITISWDEVSPDNPMPFVEITKPKNNYIYLMDRALFINPFVIPIPICLGDITIACNAVAEFGISKIEFYVNNERRYTTEDTYTWVFHEDITDVYKITVKVYTEFKNTEKSKQVLSNSASIILLYIPL